MIRAAEFAKGFMRSNEAERVPIGSRGGGETVDQDGSGVRISDDDIEVCRAADVIQA